MAKVKESLAFQLEKRRKLKGLSQEGLGELVGLSKQTIWSIEKGNTGVSFDVIAKLAKVLECEETDLVSPDPRHAASQLEKLSVILTEMGTFLDTFKDPMKEELISLFEVLDETERRGVLVTLRRLAETAVKLRQKS